MFTAPETQAFPVAHLPVLRALMDQLGIPAILDAALPKHRLSRVSDADCVVAMMLNILCGRVALFRMDWWLARTDVELLLGEGREADAFDDNRLSAALDHLDALGTDSVLTEVVRRFLDRPGRERSYSVHQDFTTISLHGEYADISPTGPKPMFGHSKDLRPDLKQLVFGLALHGSVGVPLLCTTFDGNTSDTHANRDQLARLAKLLPTEDDVTIVADCKLVDPQTLGQIAAAGFHFVSLLPNAYKLRAKLVNAAWEANPDVTTWPVLGSHAGRLKSDPPTLYRGKSVEAEFPMLLHPPLAAGVAGPKQLIASGETLRFLLVHSDALAANFAARLPGRIADEAAAITAAVTRFNRKPGSCERDALAAAQTGVGTSLFHQVVVSVESVVQPVKRKGRGRPTKGSETPTTTVWCARATAVLDEVAVARERREASCFPLITDHLDTAGWDDARILSEYRHQGIIEGITGFRWLKGPAAVAPMFLKTPTRMRALGLVMVLALMVRNYWQFTMRSAAREAGEKIVHPFTRRPVANLTAEMAMDHFGGLHVVRLQLNDTWCRSPPKLSDTATQILRYLAVPPSVFWTPPREKMAVMRL